MLEQVPELGWSFSYSCWIAIQDAAQDRQEKSCAGQGGVGVVGPSTPSLGAPPS